MVSGTISFLSVRSNPRYLVATLLPAMMTTSNLGPTTSQLRVHFPLSPSFSLLPSLSNHSSFFLDLSLPLKLLTRPVSPSLFLSLSRSPFRPSFVPRPFHPSRCLRLTRKLADLISTKLHCVSYLHCCTYRIRNYTFPLLANVRRAGIYDAHYPSPSLSFLIIFLLCEEKKIRRASFRCSVVFGCEGTFIRTVHCMINRNKKEGGEIKRVGRRFKQMRIGGFVERIKFEEWERGGGETGSLEMETFYLGSQWYFILILFLYRGCRCTKTLKLLPEGGRRVENYSLVCKQANINFAELSIKSCKFVNFLSKELALQILQYFNNNHSESKKYTPSLLAIFLWK